MTRPTIATCINNDTKTTYLFAQDTDPTYYALTFTDLPVLRFRGQWLGCHLYTWVRHAPGEQRCFATVWGLYRTDGGLMLLVESAVSGIKAAPRPCEGETAKWVKGVDAFSYETANTVEGRQCAAWCDETGRTGGIYTNETVRRTNSGPHLTEPCYYRDIFDTMPSDYKGLGAGVVLGAASGNRRALREFLDAASETHPCLAVAITI